MTTIPALSVVFLLTSISCVVRSRPEGPPPGACPTLTPEHPGTTPQTSTVPYVIDLTPFDDGSGGLQYTPGQTYTCTF